MLVSARELLLSSHKIIYSCNTIHTYRSTILIGLAILFIDQLNQFIAAVRRYVDRLGWIELLAVIGLK